MGDYKIPSLTTDIFIFDDDFNFILIKRKNDPYKDYWALPGGFVEYGESVETAAIREAKEETSIDVELKDLVNVYSKPDRDPRGHTVTIAYTAKGDFASKKADSDASDIGIDTANIVFIILLRFSFLYSPFEFLISAQISFFTL
jgi:8-oxo-dGTP diphosphatase